WKAKMLSDIFQFSLDTVRHNARQENPFVTEANQMRLYVESNLKNEFPPVSFSFILQKLADRSEAEWKQRFKAMRKHLGWSYDDIARFIGAASGAAVRASVNRKLPAMAKLAVCVFEQMKQNAETPKQEKQD
ncbi:MAG: hypothetical protein AAB316_00015, partial [Bacteroidota bacterium]